MISTMTPRLRKFALIAHVTLSVGLLGAIAAFLALAVTGLTHPAEQTVRFTYPAMALIVRFVIVPLALASLLTGLIQSLGTPWGLFRHYWVIAKLLITVFAITILLIKTKLIDYAARLSEQATLPLADLHAAGLQLVVHAAGGLLVLLVPMVLSIYKPWGLTSYGRSRQPERRASSQQLDLPSRQRSTHSNRGSGGGSITITLRRAYVVGFAAIVVAAHMLVLHLTHGGLSHH